MFWWVLCFGVWVIRASKPLLGHHLKLAMFRWVLCLEAQVAHALKPCQFASKIWNVLMCVMLQGSHYPHVKIHIGLLQNE